MLSQVLLKKVLLYVNADAKLPILFTKLCNFNICISQPVINGKKILVLIIYEIELINIR